MENQFNIPYSFTDENESYFTLPAMKKFAKEKRKEDLKTTVDRATLINDINNYANQNKENKEAVLNWLDYVLKEGIKEIQIKKLDIDLNNIELLQNKIYVDKILNPIVYDKNCMHLCNIFLNELKLYRYDYIENSENGNIISLYLGKLISTYDKTKNSQTKHYPIIVEIFVDKKLIVARAKSKSGMFRYMEKFVFEAAISTHAEKELKQAIQFVTKIFSLETIKAKDVNLEFRNKLYKMLEKYTKTPIEIVNLMNNKSNEINCLSNQVIQNICDLNYSFREDVVSDINNLVEKYFSISYPDKKIFTKERGAYPLKIIATDDEDSKLEQTASAEEPLQSKAVFFDNKKMLQKSMECDGVYFRFNRVDPTYCSKQFNVKIVAKKDFCTIKFTEYTMEEDILNVLFSFIGA